jgi:hypothetical protein
MCYNQKAIRECKKTASKTHLEKRKAENKNAAVRKAERSDQRHVDRIILEREGLAYVDRKQM